MWALVHAEAQRHDFGGCKKRQDAWPPATFGILFGRKYICKKILLIFFDLLFASLLFIKIITSIQLP
jgi:hypothetical protein